MKTSPTEEKQKKKLNKSAVDKNQVFFVKKKQFLYINTIERSFFSVIKQRLLKTVANTSLIKFK